MVKSEKLSNMTKGWFVGNFEPSVLKTNDAEVAVKTYKKGETEAAHFHKIAAEITVVISGKVRMFDREWEAGDIIVVEPNDVTAFEALTDAMNVVVKIPGVNNDKYLTEEKIC